MQENVERKEYNIEEKKKTRIDFLPNRYTK